MPNNIDIENIPEEVIPEVKKKLVKVSELESKLFGRPTEQPGVNEITIGGQGDIQNEEPTIDWNQTYNTESVDNTNNQDQPLPPEPVEKLVEDAPEPVRPALKFLAVPPDEEPIWQKKQPGEMPNIDDAASDIKAFLSGGQKGLRKERAHRQVELALTEMPLTDEESFDLKSLTKYLDETSPDSQTDSFTFILDNFNKGLLGDHALDPRLPPELTGTKGIMYSLAGTLANLSGFGVRLAAVNKIIRAPEITNAMLNKTASMLENKGAEKSFNFLVKHRDLASKMISEGLAMGVGDAAFTPTEEDLLPDKIITKGKQFSKGFGTGFAFAGLTKGINIPLSKVISSDGAREFASSATFGSLMGLAKPVHADITKDPLGWVQEKLINAGLGAAAFSINHAIWKAFPAISRRYFKWKYEKGNKKKFTDNEIEELRKIFDDLEKVALRSKIHQENEDSKLVESLPKFNNPETKKKFVSPAPRDREPYTFSEMVETAKSKKPSSEMLVDIKPTHDNFIKLLNSDPLKHPGGFNGYKKEMASYGEAGVIKDAFEKVGVLTGRVAPVDVRALKEGTYLPFIKKLFGASDAANLDALEFSSGISRAEDIIYASLGAKTKSQKQEAFKEIFLKIKDPKWEPPQENNPEVREYIIGQKKQWDTFFNEEHKLGYQYNYKKGYVPEVAKTKEAMKEIQENRIKFATRRDIVSGEVFNPSSLSKSDRGGAIENVFLQAKFRARSFAQIKNLSRPSLEFAVKFNAIEEYIPPETRKELGDVYNMFVKHQTPEIDKYTDNTLNGVLSYIDKVLPKAVLMNKYGGPGISRRISGKSGKLKSLSFFPWNTQFHIRNRGQVLQAASLTGPSNLISSIGRKIPPGLSEIIKSDPYLSNYIERVQKGEHFIDSGTGGKGFLAKGVDWAVGKSHMANFKASLVAAYKQGIKKVAQGKWTQQELIDNLYWTPRLTQYSYDPSRVPKIFHSAIGREAFRFKSWGINKLFYLQELSHRVKTGTTGFGAPLDMSDRVNSALQLAWEAGIPTIKKGGKFYSAMQILDKMRAVNSLPGTTADLFGDSIETGFAIRDMLVESDKRKRKKAKSFLLKRAALSYVPGGHSIARKLYLLPKRGFAKTFIVPPTEEDYKEWRKAELRRRAF